MAAYSGCRLRLVASHKDFRDLHLPSGPEAARGILVHRVIELWEKGAGGDDPDVLFDAQLEQTQTILRADPTRAHFADLKSTMLFGDWLELRAVAKAKCRRRSTPQNKMLEETGAPIQSTGKSNVGVEVGLISDSLRLSGRADRVRQTSPGSFVVLDYKTGDVLKEDGTIKEESVFQIQCYGMMLLERYPEAEIRLVIDNGEEHAVPFGKRERIDIAQQIDEIVGKLPSGVESSAESLASPGVSCVNCPVRHICPAYLKIAPIWWRNYPAGIGRIPTDTWGEITEIKTDENGLVIRLKDAAERPVKITGILPRHGLSSAIVGKPLFLFNLVYTGSGRDRGGRPFYPHGFHEKPRDRGEWQAWALQLFEG